MFQLHIIMFIVSAVGIAYQVALIRIFTIAQWHHFAYMIISIAMLGFGAGGTALALAGPHFGARKEKWLGPVVLMLGMSLPLCYALSGYVPFETFEIVSQTRQQLSYLPLLYCLLAAPFFLCSVSITLALMLGSERIGRLYCTNMVGSGVGAFSMIGLSHLLHPQFMPAVMAVVVAAAFLLTGRLYPVYPVKRAVVGAALLAAAIWAGAAPVRISEYKGLSYVMQYPDARVIAETSGPLAVLTAVASEQIRETPGQLSHAYRWSEQGPIPDQIGLFFDAGGMSPVTRFDGRLETMSYWDYVTPALAYHLVAPLETLVIGAGGGSDVLGALYHGAQHVTAVEVNPHVFGLLRTNEELRDFSGGLYERPDVRPVVADGRGFLQSNHDTYDVIQIALLDSFSAASAGVHALNESYLYTVEALELFLRRLKPNGVVTITRWLKTPPRDALKLFATAVAACEKMGVENPGDHLAFIRSWNTGTVVLSRKPLSEAQIEAARDFAESRQFDLCYLPGMHEDEANRFTVLEEATYYQFARDILSRNRHEVYDDALFHLRPATDNKPYFFHFMKWSSVPLLIRSMGVQWAPFVEWGYITLIATLIQGALVSAVLILLPLVTLAKRPRVRRARFWAICYFAGLGLAYMFLEIAVIQRLMLFLAYPVYAVTVTLTGFLVFSGLGSFVADVLYRRGTSIRPGKTILIAAVGITAIIAVYAPGLPVLFRLCAGWSDPYKIFVALIVIAPLAFIMGMPFPTGLQRITDSEERLLPWAWGINGCSSVVGASLATLVAIHGGFPVLAASAAALYLGCAAAMHKLEQRLSDSDK